METYLVGGAVRDKLLHLPVRERDWVVVGATPEEMLALGYIPVGRDFPVFLHPETRDEYALARTERKTGHGYTGFATCSDPGITLEQDLLRRDLTINAMAETAHGELIDPYGGREDLDNGVLRHVSPAFAEDPVRILRIARFAARFSRMGFHVAHDTNRLMRTMVARGEVDYLVPERVWAELVKALAENTPARFFEVLQGCNALEKLFPEMGPLAGTPDADPWRGLEAMITRMDPKTNSGDKLGDGIDLETGIQILTINGAKAMMHEDKVGTIEVGKFADMVILDENLFEIPATEISEVKVLTTIMNGDAVFVREEALEALKIADPNLANEDLDDAIDEADLNLLAASGLTEDFMACRCVPEADLQIAPGHQSAPDAINQAFSAVTKEGYEFVRHARQIPWEDGKTYWIQWARKGDSAVLFAYDPEAKKLVEAISVGKKER